MARARCPTCRAHVDPTRGRRIAALVTNLRRPASNHVIDVTLWVGALGALALAAIAALVFWGWADRWWPATMLLFGPRWVLLLPVIPVAIGAVIRDRGLLLPLAAAGWLIIGPVMGVQTGWRSVFTQADPTRDITVATFNGSGGWPILAERPDALMRDWNADVAAFQECGSYALSVALRDLEGWHTWWQDSLCLVSRYEILEVRMMDREAIGGAGGSGLVASYRLAGDDGPFWLTNVHLDTPGDALMLIRSGRVLQGIRTLRQVSLLREIEHRRAQRFAAERGGPHIVAGDFNAPDESRVYRSEWGRWTNAFASAGVGIGGTRLSGWIRARIDHVLVDGGWSVVDARLGEDVGSDHLPMIVTLRRK